ncbi:MAG: trypsin-like peptidase domain-containing protein, partial [Oscillospiraceae bacterium]|nr:trypsin-like peptidase domain-containing protein [Oscillospiraceae bacterium]
NFDDNNETTNSGAEPNGSANTPSNNADASLENNNVALNQTENNTAENEVHSNGIGTDNEQQPQVNPYSNDFQTQPQNNSYGNVQQQAQDSPYGNVQQQPPQDSPYGNVQQQPQANPYGNTFQQQPQDSPYANVQQQPQANPYDNVQQQANPYGNAQQQQTPYAASAQQPQANPYGNVQQQPPQANPYVNAQQQQNPYAASAQQPQLLPYTPDVVLPPGVQPQFINGNWYYLNSSKPPKAKMATSLKVFIGIIIVLTISFIGTFIWWTAANADGSLSDGNSFIFQLPTEEATTKKSDKSDVGKYADPNGPEITLKDNETANGSTEKAYEALSESVVSVSLYDQKDDVDKAYPESEGSGIIISSDGYIVTNAHVINNSTSGYKIKITKTDNTSYLAVVVGCDTRTDIAVLRCEEASNWKAATFADSDGLKIGQNVVVIGNPGGSSYSDSLTSGIISALNRSLSGFACTYIQTDAAINPGNSGGPLANLNGQVVGITTVKVAATDYEGMGFAIPSKKVKEIANSIIKNGYVEGRVKLGITCTELPSTLAKEYDIKGGIVVNSVKDDSPLKNSKVKRDDIITAIDGKSVTSYGELYTLLDTYKPGDTVELTVARHDDSKTDEFTVTVTLTADNG